MTAVAVNFFLSVFIGVHPWLIVFGISASL